MLERNYQSKLIERIEQRFPGCVVIKNDSGYIQGVPDLLILYKTHWAMLECKRHKNSSKRINQSYYVQLFKYMSFASFIFPENEEEVLNEMESLFKS